MKKLFEYFKRKGAEFTLPLIPSDISMQIQQTTALLIRDYTPQQQNEIIAEIVKELLKQREEKTEEYKQKIIDLQASTVYLCGLDKLSNK